MRVLLFFFFFLFSFTSLSSFFTHIEMNQSVGGAKTGVPGEKPPDTTAGRTWLVSHMNVFCCIFLKFLNFEFFQSFNVCGAQVLRDENGKCYNFVIY